MTGDGIAVAAAVAAFAPPAKVLSSRSFRDALAEVSPGDEAMLGPAGTFTDPGLRTHEVFSPDAGGARAPQPALQRDRRAARRRADRRRRRGAQLAARAGAVRGRGDGEDRALLARAGAEGQRLMAKTPKKIGRYKILGELGRGAMGVVYKADDPNLDRSVALKTIMLDKDADGRAEYQKRFMVEAKAAGKLTHPNIVTVYDFGEVDGVAYLAMELVEGTDLRKRVQQGALPAVEAVEIGCQVAEGLALRARARHRASRHQAGQHHAARPRRGEDHGLRPRAHARRRPQDQHRHRARHAALHVARADHRPAGRPALRHLLARHRAVGDAHRQAPVLRHRDARRSRTASPTTSTSRRRA